MSVTPGLPAQPEPRNDTPLDSEEHSMSIDDTTPDPTTSDATGETGAWRPQPALDGGTTTAASVGGPTAALRRVRVGTTVWGLVVLAVGIGILALAAGAVFDEQLAAIGLIAAAGAALLVGSLLTASGRRR